MSVAWSGSTVSHADHPVIRPKRSASKACCSGRASSVRKLAVAVVSALRNVATRESPTDSLLLSGERVSGSRM